MSGLREIFKSASTISITNVFVSLFNFVIFLLLFNTLGAFGFGLYTLAISFLSIATFFVDAGISKVIVSDVSKELSENNKEKAAGLFKGYMVSVTGIAIIGGTIIFLLSGFIANFLQNDIELLIKLIATLIILSGFKSVYSTSFEVLADFKTLSLFRGFESFTKLILIFIIISFISTALEMILIGLIISELALMIVFFFMLPNKIKEMLFRFKANRFLFFKMITKHGKWAAIFSQARSLESNLTFWIIEFFLGVSAVGIFSALLKIQNIITRIFEPLETIFYPYISKLGNVQDSRKTIIKAAKLTFLVSIPIVLLVMIFSTSIIELVIGPEFIIHENVLRVLLLVVFLVVLNTPMKPILFDLKAQKSLTKIAIILLGTTIILGSLLTFSLGILGMAIHRVLIPIIDLKMKIDYINKKTNYNYSMKDIISIDEEDKNIFRKGIMQLKNFIKL